MHRPRKVPSSLPIGLVVSLALSLAVSLALSACGKGRTAAPVLEPVRAVTPPRPAPAAPVGYIGVVVAGESAEIEPKAEGRIEAVFVGAGDAVVRGAPLARLDVKRARHELDVARAALREASRRFVRRRSLSRTNAAAITTEELEGAERDVLQERARVAQLAEAVNEAVLTAPFAGTVAERYLAAGAMAGPGRAIFRLVSAGEPRVRFAIPEERAPGVVPGRLVDVAIAPLGLSLRGKVSGVSPEVDTSSRMVYATATLEPGPATTAAGAKRLSTGLITRVFLAEGVAASIEKAPAPAPEAAPEPAPPPTVTTLTPPPSRPATTKSASRARKRAGGLDKW